MKTYTWNLADSLTATGYPSGRTVTTAYDVANRPISLSGSIVSGTTMTTTPYMSISSYAPQGAPASQSYANGVNRAYLYNNRLQPYRMTDSMSTWSNPLLDLQYYYGGSTVLGAPSANNNGNPTQVTLGVAGGSTAPGSSASTFTQAFAYDSINRLSSAAESGAGSWTQTFGYDTSGNNNMYLASSTAYSSPTTGLPSLPLMPTASSSFSATTNQLLTASYDNAGNQTTVGGLQLQYDGESRMAQVHDPSSGNIWNYAYDGLGQRVSTSEVGASGSITFVHDAFGNLAMENNPSGTSPACDTCYVSWDHLGSTRMVTDENGAIISRHDYLPFGGEIPSGFAGRSGQQPTLATDENGVSTAYNYDSLNRPLSAIRAQGTPSESWTQYGYLCWSGSTLGSCASGNAPNDFQVKQDQTTKGGGEILTEAVIDGLGRTSQTHQYESSGYITTATTYDGLGRTATVTNPYRSGTPVYEATATCAASAGLTN